MATANWACFFDHLTGVDINRDYIAQFRSNFPSSETIEADTPNSIRYDQAFCNRLQKKFDLVSADNPSGLYGKDKLTRSKFCEHFEFIKCLPEFCKPGGFLLFPVNLCPYTPKETVGALDTYGMLADSFQEWSNRRSDFYGRSAQKLSPMWVASFYTKFFDNAVQFVAFDLRDDNIPGREPHLAHFLFRCTA